LAPWRSSAWQPRACGEWIEPGNGEHLLALLRRQPRGDQRARFAAPPPPPACLAQAGDQPVAARKVLLQRRRADRVLADQRAAFGDAVRQVTVARGIDPVEPGADHRDGRQRIGGAPSSAPSWAAPSMPSARPDTIGEPLAGEGLGELARVLQALGVGLRLPTIASARARQPQRPAQAVQQQRRVFDLQQRGGYSGSPG
jgi:hypothetical protein